MKLVADCVFAGVPQVADQGIGFSVVRISMVGSIFMNADLLPA